MTAPTIARWLAVLACALLARAAHADFGDILQPYANASASIQYYAPMGQSFTAVSADFTTFGFRIEACNPSYPNNPLTYSLYAGETASGTPLATRQVSLPDGDNYVDADFSGVSLVPGQKYTMVLTAQSARGCVRLNGYQDNMLPANDYLGGSMLWEGTFYSGGDLTFRLIASPKADVGRCGRQVGRARDDEDVVGELVPDVRRDDEDGTELVEVREVDVAAPKRPRLGRRRHRLARRARGAGASSYETRRAASERPRESASS